MSGTYRCPPVTPRVHRRDRRGQSDELAKIERELLDVLGRPLHFPHHSVVFVTAATVMHSSRGLARSARRRWSRGSTSLRSVRLAAVYRASLVVAGCLACGPTVCAILA